jgi:hypothetical protein
MRKMTWMKGTLLALAVVLSACNSGEKEGDNEVVEKTNQTDEPNETASSEQASIEKEGTYVGQADNNSIEVKTADETLVLRLTDEVRETVADLEENTSVTIVYKKNENGQWLLENITEKAESGSPASTKMLEYNVDGTKIQKEAELTVSEQDYYFYKIDDFEFTAEEPRKDILFASVFAETFVRIEPLSDDASLDDMKTWANDELSAIGEVQEVQGGEVAGPTFDSAPLFLTASVDSFKKYIVIQELDNGQKMKFTINLPKHEKTAEWEQAIWAMLSTVQMK